MKQKRSNKLKVFNDITTTLIVTLLPLTYILKIMEQKWLTAISLLICWIIMIISTKLSNKEVKEDA